MAIGKKARTASVDALASGAARTLSEHISSALSTDVLAKLRAQAAGATARTNANGLSISATLKADAFSVSISPRMPAAMCMVPVPEIQRRLEELATGNAPDVARDFLTYSLAASFLDGGDALETALKTAVEQIFAGDDRQGALGAAKVTVDGTSVRLAWTAAPAAGGRTRRKRPV